MYPQRAIPTSQRLSADDRFDVIIAQQPAAIQAFLLQTALLDHLSAPLCDAITEYDCSATLLDAVERANLFLVPLDAKQRTYRYHDQFAEALRIRLWREQPALARAIHLRAGAWYIAEGRAAEAIPHLLAVGALEDAADLLAQLAEPLLLRGEVATVQRWLPILPDALVQLHTPLVLARSVPQMADDERVAPDANIQRFAAGPVDPARAPAPPVPIASTAPAWEPESTVAPRISPRERELLDCLVAGLANKEIAQRLGLTPGTVKWYLAELYKKLDVGSRTQALARARSLGVLQ